LIFYLFITIRDIRVQIRENPRAIKFVIIRDTKNSCKFTIYKKLYWNFLWFLLY